MVGQGRRERPAEVGAREAERLLWRAGLLQSLKRVVDERRTGLTLHHNSGAKARQDAKGA